MESWKIKIVDNPCKVDRDIYIFRRADYEKTEVIGWDEKGRCIGTIFPPGEVFPPSISLSPETLQNLADELNNMGIKPQKGFLEGKLEATDKHLEDMRRLVFKNNE